MKSPYLNLTLTPESDNQKKFSVWRVELTGDSEDSNMMILDTKIHEIEESLNGVKQKAFTWGDLKNGSTT